jgi:DNA-binding response OmpR family regulator
MRRLSEDPEPVRSASPARFRILVVEDDAEFAELVHLELASAGYHVRVARSVGEARQILRDETHPHLIVSDIRMPGGLGFELLRCERTDAVRVPVVLMSAFPTSKLPEFAEVAGAAFLAKPFSFDQLHALIRKVLSKPVANRLVSFDFREGAP